MKADKRAMLLYAVTDRSWLGGHSLAARVEQAIQGGATFVQLREKELPYDDFAALAQEIKKITDLYRVPFVINDNVDVALACNADGVHVGQGDMEAAAARSLLGPGKIIGVSVNTVEEAILAQRNGADYLGVGALFATPTKPDAATISLDTLQAICRSVSLPVVAIGGINEDNILKLKGSGIAGIAVVSALFAQQDVYAAARRLAVLAKGVVNA